MQRISLLCLAPLILGGSLLASPAAGQQTLADTLGSLDRYTRSEDENGLDRPRFSQRNWYDFDILFAAVVLDESLLPAVTDPNTVATLFAPTDRAFQLLAYDLTGHWFRTEADVLDAIVAAVTAGEVNLGNVLGYHVVGAKVERRNVPFDVPVETLNGNTITFRSRFFGFLVELEDNVSAFRNPFLVRTDIDAGNSVIHSISRVLIPADING